MTSQHRNGFLINTELEVRKLQISAERTSTVLESMKMFLERKKSAWKSNRRFDKKKYEFINEFLIHLNIGGSAYNFKGPITAITSLEVPLIVTQPLMEEVVFRRNSFYDH